jgi:hypothetical protein
LPTAIVLTSVADRWPSSEAARAGDAVISAVEHAWPLRSIVTPIPSLSSR